MLKLIGLVAALAGTLTVGVILAIIVTDEPGGEHWRASR